jgi:hypothetical protein
MNGRNWFDGKNSGPCDSMIFATLIQPIYSPAGFIPRSPANDWAIPASASQFLFAGTRGMQADAAALVDAALQAAISKKGGG